MCLSILYAILCSVTAPASLAIVLSRQCAGHRCIRSGWFASAPRNHKQATWTLAVRADQTWRVHTCRDASRCEGFSYNVVERSLCDHPDRGLLTHKACRPSARTVLRLGQLCEVSRVHLNVRGLKASPAASLSTATRIVSLSRTSLQFAEGMQCLQTVASVWSVCRRAIGRRSNWIHRNYGQLGYLDSPNRTVSLPVD